LPILNSFHRRLSLVLAIWFAFFTTTILIIFINCHKPNEELDKHDDDRRKIKDSFNRGRNRPSRRPEKNLLYEEQIMLSRLIKGKDV
jgi:hypothetical protein